MTTYSINERLNGTLAIMDEDEDSVVMEINIKVHLKPFELHDLKVKLLSSWTSFVEDNVKLQMQERIETLESSMKHLKKDLEKMHIRRIIWL